MKAYKVFDENWQCLDFQYKVGETYEMDGEIKMCERGFHACLKLSECFNYYDFDSNNKVAEVEILGEYLTHQEDSKVVTNKIKIVKELSWYEILDMVNTGKENTGIRNSSNWNTGNCNSGNKNSGARNSGNMNSGYWNSGYRNSGNRNSGDRNSGSWNSGNWNSGDCNSGEMNSGDLNSGDWNSGDCNSGDCNSGNRNSGDWNSGSWNSGNWNSGNKNSGSFNTNNPDKIRLFNKWISIEDYNKIKFPSWLYFDLTKWVNEQDMTDQEKIDHPEYQTTGGYLKVMEYKEAFQESYNNATKEKQDKIKDTPGFVAEIFFEISGIKVE